MAAFLGSLVNVGKMLRNAGMGIKAVNYVEILCQLRSLLRQVRSGTAAQHQHINLICMACRLRGSINLDPLSLQLHISRIPAGEHCHQLHVIILTDSSLNAPAQIAIAINTNSHYISSFLISLQCIPCP